jgi:hypothetical protein
MGTVRDNMGTVLEHLCLTELVRWTARGSRTRVLGYVDTHAMAPYNLLVGRDPRAMVSDLIALSAVARPELGEYGRTLAAVATTAKPNPYPTHFIHAARAARAESCELAAWLFEDDSKRESGEASRHADLLRMRSADVPGLASLSVTARPASFRDALGTAIAPKTGPDACVAFSDPMRYKPDTPNPGGADLGRDDLEAVGAGLRALFPNVVTASQAVFLGDANGRARGWKESICAQWRERFPARGQRNSCRVIEWGGFAVLVGTVGAGNPSGIADVGQSVRAMCDFIDRTVQGQKPRRAAEVTACD